MEAFCSRPPIAIVESGTSDAHYFSFAQAHPVRRTGAPTDAVVELMQTARALFPSSRDDPALYTDGFPRYAKLRALGLVQAVSERQFRKFRSWKMVW